MKLYIKLINPIFIAFIVFVLAYAPAKGQSKRQNHKYCIVLDPGHGGKDCGASRGGVYEKDINLGVALALGRAIERERSDVKVVYTRRDDRFVTLSDRCRIANDANATLFISIHTNANKKPEPYGTETYVMGVDKAGANLSVAMRENGVISLEKDYSAVYQGYDPESAESFIIFSLMQYSYQQSSLQLADLIQKSYVKDLTYTKSRGVKQAGFLVLWQAAMPSVLTEIGFISNAQEAKVMQTEKGQAKIASSLHRAVMEYLGELDKKSQVADNYASNSKATLAQNNSSISKAENSKPSSSGSKNQPNINVSKGTGADKSSANVDLQVKSEKDGSNFATQSSGKQNITTPSKGSKHDESPVGVGNSSSMASGGANKNNGKTIFRVQVRSTSKPVDINSRNFGRYARVVDQQKIGEMYKYYVGSVETYKEILILQKEIRELFPDAFSVAFCRGELIPMKDARRMAP